MPQIPRPVNNVVVDYETALERRHSQLLATSGLNHHEGKAVLARGKDLDACRPPGHRIRSAFRLLTRPSAMTQRSMRWIKWERCLRRPRCPAGETE